jgi:hypothetical protein
MTGTTEPAPHSGQVGALAVFFDGADAGLFISYSLRERFFVPSRAWLQVIILRKIGEYRITVGRTAICPAVADEIFGS